MKIPAFTLLLLFAVPLPALIVTTGFLDFSYTGVDNSKRWIGPAFAEALRLSISVQPDMSAAPARQMRIHRDSHKKGNRPVDLYTFGDFLDLNYLLSGEYEIRDSLLTMNLQIWDVTRQRMTPLSLEGAEKKISVLAARACSAFIRIARPEAVPVRAAPPFLSERELGIFAVAVDHDARGHFSEAIYSALRLLDFMPDCVPARLMLSRLYRRVDRPSDALDAARAALKLDPASCEAASEVGLDLLASGKGEKALRFLKERKSACAGSPALNEALGLAYLSEGFFTIAVSYLVKAISANPVQTDLYYSLGRAHMGAEDFGKAIKTFERALELEPGNPLYRCMLGTACRDGGDVIRAVQVLEDLLAAEPDYLPGVFQLSACYNKLGWTKKAFQVLHQAGEKHPESADLLAGLGVTALRAGQRKEAGDFFDRALDLDRHNPVVLNNYGVYQLARQDYGEAVDLLSKALSRDKRNPGIAYNLAVGYFRLNKIRPAKKYLELTLESSPSHLEARKLMVEVYKTLDDPQKALSVLSEIITLDNTDWDSKVAFAQLLLSTDDREQGASILEDVVKNNPGNNEYFFMLIDAYKLLEWWDIALLKLQKLIDKNGENALALSLQGEISFRKALMTPRNWNDLCLSALFSLRKAAALDPKRPETLFWMARVLWDFKGEKDEARNYFMECQKANLPVVLLREARAYLKKK